MREEPTSNRIHFGYKMCWLAFPNADPSEIITALGLRNVRRADAGYRTIYESPDGSVFVTPPIRGWVLIPSIALPEIGTPGDVFTPFLQNLSRQFGSALYFGTHRVVEYHAWAKAQDGVLERAYAYLGESGETLRDSGAPTKEEVDLDLLFSEDCEDRWPDEEDVLRIAGAWSLNPCKLDTDPETPEWGWLGFKPAAWPTGTQR